MATAMGLDRLGQLILGKGKIDAQQVRACRMVRNQNVLEVASPNGVVLKLPLANHPKGLAKLASRWTPRDTVKSYELEEVGAFVWSCLDGVQTFDLVVKKLMGRYKMNRLEAEVSLLDFLKTLSSRGLVSILEDKKRK